MRFFSWVFILILVCAVPVAGQQPDTVFLCAQYEGQSETGGHLVAVRASGADDLLSMQFRLNWTLPGEPVNYFYHPDIPESPFAASNVQPDFLVVSYFTQNVDPFGVPDGAKLIQLEFDQDPGPMFVDYMDFSIPDDNTFLQVIPGAEQCPILPPPVEAQMVVNVDDLELPEVLIYPNPSTGAVWFEAEERTHVKVFDISGRLSWSGTLRRGNILLRPGSYFLFTEAEAYSMAHKLMIIGR